jgi:putative tricarboxylic transport membrane protein
MARAAYAASIAIALSLPFLAAETVPSRAAAWKPDRPVELIVGTDPGSGFDRMARVLQKIWQTEHFIDVPVTVVNKPGGSGAIGWAYMNQHAGSGSYLAIISPLLLSNNLTGNSPLSFHDMTPVAVLEDEEIAFAVFSGSTIKTGADFIAKLKQDPSSVSVGVSGIGGQNHIALALVAAANGIVPTKLKVVSFSGSGDVVTAVIGGHVESTASPASSVEPQVVSGRMRAIAISAEKRLAGILADVPTWKEQGTDAVFSNWRGLVGPKNMTPEQIAFWNEIFAKTIATKDWQDEVTRSHLVTHYLDAKDTGAFLVEENDKQGKVMAQLGLSAKK